MWVETFTGLRVDQFGRPLRAVRERGGEGSGWGRPWRLPLAEQVLLVAVYYRTTNLTMRQLAPLFGVSPAAVCRVIQRLGPLLALELTRACADATDRLWIVDGTLVPVRDRGQRHHRRGGRPSGPQGQAGPRHVRNRARSAP